MAIERYKIIKLTEHEQWLPESPVKIEKSQLLLDIHSNKIILQIKLFNLSDKIIKAVFLDIDCFDAANDFLSSLKDVVIQGEEAKPHSNFGDRQPIILEHSNTSNVKIIIDKVVFIDDNVWRNEEKNPGTVLPEQKIIDQDDQLYGQLLRECSEKNIEPVYWFESTDDYWRCTCGQPNKLDLLQCGYCQAEKDWLRNCFDKEYLTEANAKFLESEEIRIIEDKKRQEELDKKTEAKKKKQKIITTIIASICLITIAVSLIIINTPSARAERQYQLSNRYLQDGEYQEAIVAFQKVIEIEPKNIPARLGLGNAYIATNEYDKAETVLKVVIDIDPNNIPAREVLFQVYLKEGNLDAANSILKEITSLDTQKDLKQFNSDLDLAKAICSSKISYNQGIKQMNDKQYLEAIDSFQKVIKDDTERYDDAQTKTSDCKKTIIDTTLQKAKDAAANKDYQTALNLLEQVLKIVPSNEEALKLKSEYIQMIETNKPKKLSAKEATKIMNAYDSGYITANETPVTVDGKQVYCFCPKGGNMFAYAVDVYSGVIYIPKVTSETSNLSHSEWKYYLKKIQ